MKRNKKDVKGTCIVQELLLANAGFFVVVGCL